MLTVVCGINFVCALQVIARIFYCVNSSWTGRITIPELRNSNFLDVSAPLCIFNYSKP